MRNLFLAVSLGIATLLLPAIIPGRALAQNDKAAIVSTQVVARRWFYPGYYYGPGYPAYYYSPGYYSPYYASYYYGWPGYYRVIRPWRGVWWY